MGLFSVKTYICKNCGKEFKKRINFNGDFCDECYEANLNEQNNLEEELQGYIQYNKALDGDYYELDDLRKISKHKEELIQKFKIGGIENGITLMELSEKENELDDETINSIYEMIKKLKYLNLGGVSVTNDFAYLSYYDEILIDLKNVFAICFYKMSATIGTDLFIAAAFTNDPYIPVFPIAVTEKCKLTFLVSDKDAQKRAEEEFNQYFPYLKYPVMNCANFKKSISQENKIKGNLNKEFILKSIKQLKSEEGIFNLKRITIGLTDDNMNFLTNMGYVNFEMIVEFFKLNRNSFWTKKFEKLGNNYVKNIL